jgi:hypothetical protein
MNKAEFIETTETLSDLLRDIPAKVEAGTLSAGNAQVIINSVKAELTAIKKAVREELARRHRERQTSG